jgi:pimeloyl-ACP methyl ester carboxylesterase
LVFANLAPRQSFLLEEDTWTALHELFFAFPQAIPLKKPTNEVEKAANDYTFYLACAVAPPAYLQPARYRLRETGGPGNYQTGLERLYDEAAQQYLPWPAGTNPSLAPNLLLFSSTSQQSNNETMKPVPQFHPLVLIHGLGGKPTDWLEGTTNYQTYLRALGYPDDSVHYYSYGNKNGVYNYQGDIREIAAGLAEVVDQLSAQHQAAGGDGRVDLLGYSLGGVVARQYLASHKTSHKVRKLITIGSPHKGSWVLGVDEAVENTPLVGPWLERRVARRIVDAVNRGKTQKLDVRSVAVEQIYPDSEFLEGYSGINRNPPQDVEYATFYGDIHAAVRRKLFHWTLEQKVSIGDGLILPESATGIPNVSPKKFAYSEDTIFNLKLNKTSDGYAFALEVPSLDSLKALHPYLLDREDLRQDLACQVLYKKDDNSCQ